MSKTITTLLWCFLCAASTSTGAELQLAAERRIFPEADKSWQGLKKPGLWGMRLSPDGESLLYPRLIGLPALNAEGVPDRHRAKYELILRNLKTGKDTALPIGPLKSGWRTVFTRFNMFDPAGERLVLADIEIQQMEEGGAVAVRPSMKLVLYDIVAAKTKATGIEGASTIGKFDRTGKGLIVMKSKALYTTSLRDLELKPLNITGLLQSVCPTADVVCVLVFPQRPKPLLRGGRPKRMPPRLTLYDYKAGKELAELPIHPRNSSLDDLETQWTADGRYLYYYDVREITIDTAEGPKQRTKPISRIWDRINNKQAGVVLDAVPLGPGPSPTTMLLAKRSQAGYEGFILHDANTGDEWRMAETNVQPIHAWGKNVVYLKGLEDGEDAVFLAQIAVPATDVQPKSHTSDQIAKLIQQLADPSYNVREQASRQLAQMGPAALPALRKAIGSEDPEVRIRAKDIYQSLVHLKPEELQQRRKEIQEAFRAADYELMIKLSERLTAAEAAGQEDWLWLGHAYQLAGKWKEAIVAYLKVVSLMDRDLETGKVMRPAPPPKVVGGGIIIRGRDIPPGFRAIKGVGMPVGPRENGPVMVKLGRTERQKLLLNRSVLAWRIGLMQTAELKDPGAAAVGFLKALDVLDKFEQKDEARGRAGLEIIRLRILRELATTQHGSDQLRAALDTWAKLHHARQEVKHTHQGGYIDIEKIAKALSSLPTGQPIPDLPCLFVLTAEKPNAKLMLDEPETRKRSYEPSSNPNSPHWRYAFAAEPGKELATLEFTCDIEQLKARHGGHFKCFVSTGGGRAAQLELGSIGWPNDKPTGREVFREKFEIPPGVKLVHIETGSWKGCFNIHSVEAKATFRPVTKDAEPLLPRKGAWVQTEMLPKGGKLTCGKKELGNEVAYSDFEPGRYRLRYDFPGRKDVFEADFLVEPGRRYGIFVNLDSPFTWVQAGPDRLNVHPPGRASIARLADGGYMATWCGSGNKIMVCSSKDLVNWAEPEATPFNSVFDNICPATITAQDGTVWLAFFSKRLSLTDTSTGGYQLWLTSTRDGQQWNRLKPVSIGTVGGWPLGAVHMLQDLDGSYRIFWRNYSAQAKSLADIQELRPINVDLKREKQLHLWNPYVLADEKGLFHMVFDSFGTGIYHSTSKDGSNWAVPTALVVPETRQNIKNPQLILSKGKALLIYERNDGAYILPVRLGGAAAKLDKSLKITSHVIPLWGSRLRLTKDGDLLLLAGSDTTWLLRAKLKELFATWAE